MSIGTYEKIEQLAKQNERIADSLEEIAEDVHVIAQTSVKLMRFVGEVGRIAIFVALEKSGVKSDEVTNLMTEVLKIRFTEDE